MRLPPSADLDRVDPPPTLSNGVNLPTPRPGTDPLRDFMYRSGEWVSREVLKNIAQDLKKGSR